MPVVSISRKHIRDVWRADHKQIIDFCVYFHWDLFDWRDKSSRKRAIESIWDDCSPYIMRWSSVPASRGENSRQSSWLYRFFIINRIVCERNIVLGCWKLWLSSGIMSSTLNPKYFTIFFLSKNVVKYFGFKCVHHKSFFIAYSCGCNREFTVLSHVIYFRREMKIFFLFSRASQMLCTT